MESGDDLRPGDPERVGSYRLIKQLGVGGQAVVYLGESPSGLRVAIKVVDPGAAGLGRAAATVIRRFVSEAQAAMRVARFCTAQVLEVNTDGDRPYIVSEYVPGPSPHEYQKAN